MLSDGRCGHSSDVCVQLKAEKLAKDALNPTQLVHIVLPRRRSRQSAIRIIIQSVAYFGVSVATAAIGRISQLSTAVHVNCNAHLLRKLPNTENSLNNGSKTKFKPKNPRQGPPSKGEFSKPPGVFPIGLNRIWG